MSSMNDEWFVVQDLDGLINSTRALIFNNFGKNTDETDNLSMSVDDTDREELDSLLSFEESKIIVLNHLKKQKHKTKFKRRYLLNDKLYLDIVCSLNDRMVSNVLNSLVNKGLVESAYDNESNDFVFWINNNDQKSKELPETD